MRFIWVRFESILSVPLLLFNHSPPAILHLMPPSRSCFNLPLFNFPAFSLPPSPSFPISLSLPLPSKGPDCDRNSNNAPLLCTNWSSLSLRTHTHKHTLTPIRFTNLFYQSSQCTILQLHFGRPQFSSHQPSDVQQPRCCQPQQCVITHFVDKCNYLLLLLALSLIAAFQVETWVLDIMWKIKSWSCLMAKAVAFLNVVWLWNSYCDP